MVSVSCRDIGHNYIKVHETNRFKNDESSFSNGVYTYRKYIEVTLVCTKCGKKLVTQVDEEITKRKAY